MKTFISGIDEAGRGPAVGPLVMAAVTIDKIRQNDLIRLGVKDSKKVSRKKREYVFPKILELVNKYQVWVIPAEEINRRCITDLCTETVARFVRAIPGTSKIYVDALGSLKKPVFIKRIVLYLNHLATEKTKPDGFKLTCTLNKRMVYEPYADDNYVVVAAASIIAKVIRDREMESWCKMYTNNQYLSGYVNPRTNRFIHEYHLQYGTLPPGVRRNWKNVRQIVSAGLESDLV